jgi:hypothetical protein
MQVQRTDLATPMQGVKGLVYGGAGVGKTFLATTAPNLLVIATEPGLLTLRRYQIPFVQAYSVAALNEVARWIASSYEARQYSTFLFDSLSEVLEIILAEERVKAGKAKLQAYGELAIKAVEIIKMYRDLAGPNIIFTSKMEREKDSETGAFIYQPRFPGKETGINAPYLFDFVFNLYIYKDMQSGVSSRWLRTQPSTSFEAKDRSGLLAENEPANLQHIFNRINGIA